MRKKSFLLALVISFICCNLFSAKTHALYIDEDNSFWWTVSELLEFKEVFDAEVETACGDDTDCVRDYYLKKSDYSDEKTAALIRLIERQFAITSINPHQEKIKILFFDTSSRDMIMAGRKRQIDFHDIHMSWFDESLERINYYSGNYSAYIREIRDDAIPGIHNIYSYSSRLLDGENPFPANYEVEIDVAGTDLSKDTYKNIHYYVNSEGNFNAVGGAQYKSCTLEPDYVEGVECRLMFSGSKGSKYMPPRETVVKDNPESEAIETTEIESSESSGDEGFTGYDGEVSTEKAEKDSIGSSSDLATISLPKSPNTGNYTSPCIHKTVEFPWWIIGFIALGDAAALWLFWPKSKKGQKSFKKSIDKRGKVR